MSETYYTLIYNKEDQTTACEKDIDSEQLTTEIISDWKNKTQPYYQFYLSRLMLESRKRKGHWNIYCDTEPFSWDSINTTESTDSSE